MYGIEKRSAILENVAGFSRQKDNVYTFGKQTSRSPERCTSWNATSAEFLKVQIPSRVFMYGCDL